MKCAVFNGKCNMTIDEREIPEPAADEVLIKIMACGVCGSDVHIFFWRSRFNIFNSTTYTGT